MELHFLGRGAAFYVEAGNTSAYLREGSRLLLLDCGESVFADLLRRGVLSGVTDITVALSHLHSDHCGSLGSLCHYCFYMLHIVPKLVLPEDAAYRADVVTLLRLFGVQENAFAFVEDGGALGAQPPARYTGQMQVGDYWQGYDRWLGCARRWSYPPACRTACGGVSALAPPTAAPHRALKACSTSTGSPGRRWTKTTRRRPCPGRGSCAWSSACGPA